MYKRINAFNLKHFIGACNVLALALTCNVVSAQSLGAASNYNVYVLSNDSQTYTDSEGAVAVGGNATFTDYTVGQSLSSGSAYNLVVGGNLTDTYASVEGSVYGGSINWVDPSITGNVSGNTVTFTGYGTVGGSVDYGSSYSNSNTGVSGTTSHSPVASPVNFGTTNQQLLNTSNAWGNLAATGSTSVSYSTLTLTGNSDSLNIFDVTSSELSSATDFVVNAPNGSTVIVNISGTSATWGGGLNLNGVGNNEVIYNFYQATTLNLQGIGIEGSVLAPLAAVDFSSGQINGGLIAGSLSGQGQENNGVAGDAALFTGSVPSGSLGVPAVPEGSGSAAMLIGTLCLASFIAKRNRKAIFKTA
jgi:choice-of-anchor A domain-containing protein